jgi:hypothetical protein
MLTNIVLLSLLTVPTPRVPVHDRIVVRPRIEVWSSHGDGVYNRGQGVRVYFRADQDAFVTIFRVDTDGRVRVLFPRDPWEDNFVRGGHEFEVQGSGNRTAFYVDDYPGMGYLFGVAAADPFEYGAIESGNHWDYRSIADGRVRGDPYVALTELAERIVPEGYADWDYDIVPYYVERQYDYPRFLCYDCHAYVSYPYWDPYWRSCVRFRIVLYDDPYYYPYRYYGGRRVVFVRPFRPQPRFVFKDRDGSGRDRFVTREANRPANDDRRRVAPTRQAGSTGSFIPAPRDAAPRDRNSSGVFQRSGEQNQRPEDRGGERRQPREDQSSERGQSNERGQAPARTERVQPSDRGQSRDERSQGSRDERPRVEQPRYTPPRETPRAEPRGQPQREQREQPRAERPRSEGRSQPQREQPRAERPRSEPKAQPQRSEPKSKDSGKDQPELRRRKP